MNRTETKSTEWLILSSVILQLAPCLSHAALCRGAINHVVEQTTIASELLSNIMHDSESTHNDVTDSEVTA